MQPDPFLNFPQKIKVFVLSKKEVSAIYLLYSSFFIFLIVQHAMVFPYHDDWGYAVLDYVGAQTGFSGQEFSISHVLDFLAGMYKNWSGRMLSLFLEIYLLKLGVWYVRLFQVLAILCALFYSMKIAIGWNEQYKRASLVFMLPILLYLSLPPEILLGGIYWFAASAGYLWGIPIFLLAAYSILVNKKITIGSSFMLAISSTFHEQMSFVAITFFLTYLMYNHFLEFKKQPILGNCLLSVPLVLLTMATIFAPGNFARKNASVYVGESVREIVWANMKSISEMFFTQHSLFLGILALSFVSLSFAANKTSIRSARDFLASCLLPITLVGCYFFLPQVLVAIIFVSLFSFVLLKSCRLCEAGIVVFSVFVASLGALIPLFMAPGVPWRSGIPFYFLLFVPILFSIVVIKEPKIKYLIMIGFLVISIFSVIQTGKIFNGYHKNYEVNMLNNYQLKIVSHKIKHNIDVTNTVILFRLPLPQYAEVMPYQRPLIETWIKKYYELPQDIRFDWR